MIDPVTTGTAIAAAGKAAKALTNANAAREKVGEALGTAQHIHKEITSVGSVVDQEISFNCPSGMVDYGLAVQLKGGFAGSLFPGKLKFHDPRIRRMTVWSAPMMRNETQAVVAAEQGFEVHLDKLSKGTENFRLAAEYEVDAADFLRSLVDAQHEVDPVDMDGRSEYWMTAQLRTVNALRSMYGRLDLRDIHMTVDVGIQHDVKTAVPPRLEKQLETQARLMKTTDREQGRRLLMQNIRMTKGTGEFNAKYLLASVQDLFLPANFRKFLSLKGEDFRYAGATRGEDMWSGLPLANFPTRMTVLSRASLSLDNPSANGTLVYQRDDFRKKLAELFPGTSRE